MPSRSRTLQIIKLKNLVHLNGLHERPHECKILNVVVRQKKKISPSPKARIRAHIFIVNNKGIDHFNAPNA